MILTAPWTQKIRLSPEVVFLHRQRNKKCIVTVNWSLSLKFQTNRYRHYAHRVHYAKIPDTTNGHEMRTMYCTNHWVLASNNAGKLREFNDLLAPLAIKIQPQAELEVPDAIEDGLSFIENALIKARHAARLTGLPALSDDSGLEVDALHGAPGIYSARYASMAGGDKSDLANLNKLLVDLKDVPPAERTARFHCVLAFMRHADDPTPIVIQGTWEGSLLQAPAGDKGFGYDPIFWVAAHGCSAAQLSKAEKNRLSHRGLAVAAFKRRMAQLLEQNPAAVGR